MFAKNEAFVQRSIKISIQKEMRKMGVRHISDLTLEQRVWLNAFMESNHSKE